MAEIQTQEQWHASNMATAIDKVATTLGDLAEDVTRHKIGIQRVGSQGRPNYGTTALEVQREVLQRLGQMRLDLVIMYATEADIARAKGE